MKIGLGIAHYPEDFGAVNVTTGRSELPWSAALIAQLRPMLLKAGYEVFVTAGSAAHKISTLNIQACDVAMEIHLNAPPDGNTSTDRTEVLHSHSAASIMLARFLRDESADMFNRRKLYGDGNRRILTAFYDDEGRKRAEDYFEKTDMPFVIYEPGFITSAFENWCHQLDAQKAIAETIVKALDKWRLWRESKT